MDFVLNLIKNFSSFMRPYTLQISMAIIATLLVIFGDSISKIIKRNVIQQTFVVRVIVFILLCTCVYGAATIFITPLLAKYISKLGNLYLSPVVVLTFFIIGIIAERRSGI